MTPSVDDTYRRGRWRHLLPAAKSTYVAVARAVGRPSVSNSR
jgi:hypothetical protein